VVTLAALATAGAAVWFCVLTQCHAEFSLPHDVAWAPMALELLLGAVILAFGLRLKSWLIVLMAVAQIGLVVGEQFLPAVAAVAESPQFVVDPLAIILILTVSVVGAIIVIYALGYMKHHVEHAPPTSAGQGRFFFFLVGFLGAMNGLVMANDLKWLGVFWEATTLCSFMLIGHDRTDAARQSAKRALLINTFGGLAMAVAAFLARYYGEVETLRELTGGWALLPIAFLILAAFTKSAQLPFQSWLLGAMVAPTPVSALLHSATMVKAGSYLVLRLAPNFADTALMYVVAAAGAFTFMAGSALAVGERNGKKVLAYSTIANLGLIAVCAAINTPLAYAAGLFVLVFHAVSKGLLFLCMGVIEQKLGSRDIEDMGSIMFKMPVTTVITLIGMVSMLLPPLGMLLSKWLAIEAAIQFPPILVLLVIGMALTVLFWTKWIGRIQTASFHTDYKAEHLSPTVLVSLVILAAVVVGGGLATMPIFQHVIAPMTADEMPRSAATEAEWAALDTVGSMHTWPFVVFLGLGLLVGLVLFRRFREDKVRPPYLCGENVEGTGLSYSFRSVADKPETSWSMSYYMQGVFTESRLTFWANLIAAMIVLTLFGVLGSL
jgi:ech hydrogenase subunit A